jgi:hypothetical protein
MRKIFKTISGAVLAAAGLAGAAYAQSAMHVTILNGTNSAIVAMQVRPSGAQNAQWTAVSPGRPIGIQGTVTFHFSAGNCNFDVQAQFADGRSLNKASQNFCRLHRTTYIIRAF